LKTPDTILPLDFVLGPGDISHDIVMRISSVKPVPWLVVNHLHLLSDGRDDADMSVKVNEIIKWLI